MHKRLMPCESNRVMAESVMKEFEIDFGRLHSAIETINLLDCQGTGVRVSGLTVESNGPGLGLGELG